LSFFCCRQQGKNFLRFQAGLIMIRNKLRPGGAFGAPASGRQKSVRLNALLFASRNPAQWPKGVFRYIFPLN